MGGNNNIHAESRAKTAAGFLGPAIRGSRSIHRLPIPQSRTRHCEDGRAYPVKGVEAVHVVPGDKFLRVAAKMDLVALVIDALTATVSPASRPGRTQWNRPSPQAVPLASTAKRLVSGSGPAVLARNHFSQWTVQMVVVGLRAARVNGYGLRLGNVSRCLAHCRTHT